MSGNIYFVGTNHMDLKGEERLAKALDYLKPEIIVKEGVEAGVIPRDIVNGITREIISGLKNHDVERKAIVNSARLFRSALKVSGYEEGVIKEYLSENPDVQFYPIEDPKAWAEMDSNISSEKLFESMGEEIGRFGTKENYQKDVDSRYRRARGSLETNSSFRKEGFDEAETVNAGMLGNRDRKFNTRLRKIIEANPDKKIVFVGGFLHFSYSSKGNTVYSQTLDLDPEILFLSESDNL